jgi:hypothetical protein
MPHPELLHLWISCGNQRCVRRLLADRELERAYLYVGNRGKADMPHAVWAMAKRLSGPAALSRRDPCTDHGNTQPAVPVRHDGVPKRAERGVEHGVYEGRKILRIVPAFLFRASGCRCLRGLRDPDRLRAFTTLNVPAAVTPASAARRVHAALSEFSGPQSCLRPASPNRDVHSGLRCLDKRSDSEARMRQPDAAAHAVRHSAFCRYSSTAPRSPDDWKSLLNTSTPFSSETDRSAA